MLVAHRMAWSSFGAAVVGLVAFVWSDAGRALEVPLQARAHGRQPNFELSPASRAV